MMKLVMKFLSLHSTGNAAINRSHMTFYYCSIVSMFLSCIISQTEALIGKKCTCSQTPLLFDIREMRSSFHHDTAFQNNRMQLLLKSPDSMLNCFEMIHEVTDREMDRSATEITILYSQSHDSIQRNVPITGRPSSSKNIRAKPSYNAQCAILHKSRHVHTHYEDGPNGTGIKSRFKYDRHEPRYCHLGSSASVICTDWHSTGSTCPDWDCNWTMKFRSQTYLLTYLLTYLFTYLQRLVS